MNRTLAREVAMKLVYSRLVGGNDTQDAILEKSEITEPLTEQDSRFAEQLVLGVTEHAEELDEMISAHAIGWSIGRIDKVDLAILRIAAYEIRYLDEIPVGASINEAVKLAKQFGGDHSYSFINGILGSLAKEQN
ncbi:MAG: transcription antitermination factor NusB [Clostridia bacterium]|nr:transcription antitermination factor NusB [Clostridia bacterium]